MDALRSTKTADSSLLRLKKNSSCSAQSKKSAARDRGERQKSFLQSIIPATFRENRPSRSNVVHPICNLPEAGGVAQDFAPRAVPFSEVSGYRVKVQVLHGLDLLNPCSSSASCCTHTFLPTVSMKFSSTVGNEQHERSFQAHQHARNHSLWCRESALEVSISKTHTAPSSQLAPSEPQATQESPHFSVSVVLSSSCSRHCGDNGSSTNVAIGETEILRMPVKHEDYELAQFVPVWRHLSSKKSALGPYAAGKIKLRVCFEVEKPTAAVAMVAPVRAVSSPHPAAPPARPSFLPANFTDALNTKRKQLKATVAPDDGQQPHGTTEFNAAASEQLMKEIVDDPTLRQIPVELVQFLDRIGEGVHSNVAHGRMKSRDGQSSKEIAIKEFRYQHAFPPPNVLATFRREYQLLEKCTREGVPQIVRFLGVLLKPRPAIVMEFFPCGSLAHCMQNEASWRKVSLLQRARIAVQVAEALSWLHAHDIVHRDVKSHNILVDHLESEAPVTKICDVGSAVRWRSQDRPLTEETGSSGYAAPEIFTNEGYTSKVDVWSFSIVLWELLHSASQVEGTIKLANLFAGLASDKFVELARSGARPSCCLQDADSPSQELLQRCWQFDPAERPSMSEVVTRLHAIIASLS